MLRRNAAQIAIDRVRLLRPNGMNGMETVMNLIERVTRDGMTPQVDRPDPAKVIKGDPVHSTWNREDANGLFCGMWQSTPGAWQVNYAEWEYVHIHSGHSILTADDGSATHLRAGDSYIIRAGFSGVWEVVETTLKDYVILG